VKAPADSVSVSRPTYVRHLVLAALCAITTISYMQRNSLASVEKLVGADLGLDSSDLGYAKGIFFLTYALLQVPSGWLAQKWGGRRTLTLYAAGWSLLMGGMAFSQGLAGLVGMRAVMGVLQAGIFPCCTMILASWYPASRRGFASAVLNSFMLIGGAIAAALTALLIGLLGWRGLFAFYALPGLAWAGWFFYWFRDRPSDHSQVNPAELSLIGEKSSGAVAVSTRAPTPWLNLIFSLPLWLICIQQFCRAGAVRFFDQSLPTYLQEARGQSIKDANLWTSLPLWAGVLGGMLGGILSDAVLLRTGSRRLARQGVAIGSLLLAVLIYILAYQFADVSLAVLTMGIGYGIMTFSSPCAYALTMDMGGRNLAIIFATMNMAGNLGATAFTTYIPQIAEKLGWNAALYVFLGMHVVAILCWLPLDPNGVIGDASERET
jgi:sugar phosphate permease